MAGTRFVKVTLASTSRELLLVVGLIELVVLVLIDVDCTSLKPSI